MRVDEDGNSWVVLAIASSSLGLTKHFVVGRRGAPRVDAHDTDLIIVDPTVVLVGVDFVQLATVPDHVFQVGTECIILVFLRFHHQLDLGAVHLLILLIENVFAMDAVVLATSDQTKVTVIWGSFIFSDDIEVEPVVRNKCRRLLGLFT